MLKTDEQAAVLDPAKLPAWWAEAERRHQEFIRAKAAKASARMSVSVPSVAPGWHDVGMEFYLGEDAVYPRDPAVTAAIHTFDPGIIPLWCRWAFLSPASDGPRRVVVFGRHGIGRYVRGRNDFAEAGTVVIPGGRGDYRGPLPTILERVFEGKKADPDLPGEYVPWDWNLYYQLRGDFRAVSVRELKQEILWEPQERKDKAAAAKAAEEEYKQADLQKYVSKVLDGFSEVEIKERLLSKGLRAKEVKPMVHLGR